MAVGGALLQNPRAGQSRHRKRPSARQRPARQSGAPSNPATACTLTNTARKSTTLPSQSAKPSALPPQSRKLTTKKPPTASPAVANYKHNNAPHATLCNTPNAARTSATVGKSAPSVTANDLPPCGELSNQVQRLFKIHFIRCSPLQTFTRAVVQCPHRFLNIFIRILRNVLMFRAIFP